MRCFRPAPRLAALASLIGLACVLVGCGDSTKHGSGDETFGGPPRWRLVREKDPEGGQALTLSVRTPVRLRLVHEGDGLMTVATPWRTLATGQSVKVVWSMTEERPEARTDRPSHEDTDAGRTELHAVSVHYHCADQTVNVHRMAGWTRPGRGAVLSLDALPPGKYEDLPPESRVELLTLAIADVARGSARLRRREHATVVRPPEEQDPGDRILVRRLFLELAPLGE